MTSCANMPKIDGIKLHAICVYTQMNTDIKIDTLS